MESFSISITPYRNTSRGILQPWSDVVIQPNVIEIFIKDDGMYITMQFNVGEARPLLVQEKQDNRCQTLRDTDTFRTQ